MFSEDELVMISDLQHLAFCERQCALICLEQQWAENRFTVLGDILHEKVHKLESEKRADVIISRSLRLVSYRLGLTGQADGVEFHLCKDGNGINISGREGKWKPFPVEYKKGKPKENNIDAVQLCAQAFCLEEQFNKRIDSGALFYGEKRRRQPVEFDAGLRGETVQLIERLHGLIQAGKTPAAEYNKKCKSCSLVNICLPKLNSAIKKQRYEQLLFFAGDE